MNLQLISTQHPMIALRDIVLHQLLIAVVVLITSGFSIQARADAPSREQIKTWVGDLGSDKYIAREDATNNLIAVGLPAINPLAEVLGDANFEVVSRGVHILRTFALSGDEKLEAAAEKALTRLSETANKPLVQRAEATLDSLAEMREELALEVLTQAGAKVVKGYVVDRNGKFTQSITGLEFDDAFDETKADLSHIGRLRSLQQLYFSGPKFNDQALVEAAKIENLTSLTVKRVKITSAGVAKLMQSKKINTLGLLYVPLKNDTLDAFAKSESLVSLRLYGTKMTKQAVDQLATKRPATDIDFRRGAFLGVGGQPTEDGCAISQVHAGSAASQAGLAVGDVIVRFNDKPVADFEGLKNLISENDAGDTVTMELKRNGQMMKREIKLGEWEK